MRFFRSAKIKEKVIDFTSKALLLALTVLVCLWMISGARAAELTITNIKQQQAHEGFSSVEVDFSSEIKKDDVNVDFQRNFIQLSLKGVSAYPARTKSFKNGLLEKIFTYQYQPDIARARILLKVNASKIQDQSEWSIDGNKLLVKVPNALTKDTLKLASAAASKVQPVKVENPKMSQDLEDEKIVQDIINEAKAAGTPSSNIEKKENKSLEDQPLFSSKEKKASSLESAKDPKAGKVLTSLLMVLGIIGAVALAFRRFVLGKGMAGQKSGKVIDVLSTQSLGPKRSIALIKVLDQYMVVGMSGDGMTLLSNLGSNVNVDKFMDEVGPGPSFSNTFKTAMSDDASPRQDDADFPITQKKSSGIRETIKKRIEGFKPL